MLFPRKKIICSENVLIFADDYIINHLITIL